MTDSPTPALQDLLFRLADDELLVGHRNSEWTGVAPILEEDIAFSSMAQDEMGHAQAYYTILHEHFNQPNPDTLAFVREPEAFRSARLAELPRSDWAAAVVRQFLYDAAEQVRIAAYTEHAFAPLAQLARKIRGEEKYHYLHGRTWVVKLGQATDKSRHKVQVALNTLWPLGLGLFEPPPDDLPSPFDENSLRQQWLDTVCPVLTEAGLTISATQNGDHWQTTVAPQHGRYAAPSDDRIELLNAMQKVYRIDPTAQW